MSDLITNASPATKKTSLTTKLKIASVTFGVVVGVSVTAIPALNSMTALQDTVQHNEQMIHHLQEQLQSNESDLHQLRDLVEAQRLQLNRTAYDDVRDLVTRLGYDIEDPDWWAQHIADASYKYQVPPQLIISVIASESSFTKKPINNSVPDAKGPMQVRTSVWAKSLEYDITDPAQNIYAGANVLRQYYDQCGSWTEAIKAYNVGITNWSKGKQKLAQQRYAQKVQKSLSKLDVSINTISNSVL